MSATAGLPADLAAALAEWSGLAPGLRDEYIASMSAPLRLHGVGQFAVRLLRTAGDPKVIYPEARGCDARRCSKHIYGSGSVCEFCCLPMSSHLVFGGER